MGLQPVVDVLHVQMQTGTALDIRSLFLVNCRCAYRIAENGC